MEKRKVVVALTGISAGVMLLYALDYQPWTPRDNMVVSSARYPFRLQELQWLNETSNTTSYDLALLENLRRIRYLHKACADESLFLNKTYRGKQNLKYYFSREYNISYCKVPKVGCTFWTQVFAILQMDSDDFKHIFEVSRAAVHARFGKLATTPFGSERIQNSRTVLVSRDTYSRLFSAFIDKIFIQPYTSRAQHVAKQQLEMPKHESACTFKVQFQEFLRDIIETTRRGGTLNRHWAPIFSLCRPCDGNVFALVKQESFSADVEYILKINGVSGYRYDAIYDALHDHKTESTIPGIVQEVLRKNIACIDRLEIAKRIWVSLQIQGFIKHDIEFPFRSLRSERKTLNASFYSSVILQTIKWNPLTTRESREQRRQSLVNAYARVDSEIIEGIKDIYKQDFILFNYSFEPPS